MRRAIDDQDWPRRLAPLVPGGEPIAGQLRRRLGATLVALSLLGGMALFLVVVFAGFGRGGIGLILAAPIGLVAAGIAGSHLRLRWAVAAFGAAHPEGFEVPPGRPSSG